MNPVDTYIENAPKEVRAKLNAIRKAIKGEAPDATERISYGMPFYSFSGEDGFEARLCYFGLLKSKKKIVFYTRPAYLDEYKEEAEKYMTAKSALQFPLDQPVPLQLIKKIVRNGIRKHTGRGAIEDSCTTEGRKKYSAKGSTGALVN